jgi:serine/threonine-protein kinase
MPEPNASDKTVELPPSAVERPGRSAPANAGLAGPTETVEVFLDDPKIGTVLDNYRITGVLGEGGMGKVYEAENVLLKRKAAVKLLPADRAKNPRAVERFLREAQAAAKLSHPNVVGVYDIGKTGGQIYIALELIPGSSIDRILEKEGPLPWREATRVMVDCCKALAAAHAVGLIHRDIKPANIMCAKDGTVKLTDFGLAKDTESTGAALTAATKIVGTPHYLSPEQARCKPCTVRSDIYSLGATYFALLTARPPYESPNHSMDVIVAHTREPVPDPRSVRPELPETCFGIIRTAMAKDPDKRYQTADEMRAALEEALAEPARPESRPDRKWSGWMAAADASSQTLTTGSGAVSAGRPVRNPGPPVAVLAGGGAVVGIAAIVGLALAFGGGSTPPTPKDPVVTDRDKGKDKTNIPTPPVQPPPLPQPPTKDPPTTDPPTKPDPVPGAVVRAAEAGRHVGETVTVEMRVEAAGSPKAGVFLNSSREWKTDPSNFTVVVFSRSLSKFGTEDGKEVAARYLGKTIRVTGKVGLGPNDKGPQIIVEDPSAIRILP